MTSLMNKFKVITMSTLAVTAELAFAAHPPSIIGKDGWLFTRYEVFDASASSDTNESIALISKMNKVFKDNDIQMLMVLVPLKMRIYSEYLGTNKNLLSPFMEQNYQKALTSFSSQQISFIDLNKAFLSSPDKNGPTPSFLKYDTHWSPSGALLAAQTIKTGIDANPVVKNVFDKTKLEVYSLVKNPSLVKTIGITQDLATKDLLPAGYPPPPTEELLGFSVKKTNAKSGLLGSSDAPEIILLGSSYSKEWAKFPAALRFTLQRDPMVISVTADKGSWNGMLTMLQDNTFQSQRPKMVIWEMPERDLRLLPGYAFRDARYKMSNQEWLLRASALAQKSCKQSNVKATVTGGVVNPDPANQASFTSKETKNSDYVEISFSKNPNKTNYLSFDSKGSYLIRAENYSPNKEANPMKFELTNASNTIKIPLYSQTGSLAKIRIYPGQTSGFSMQNIQVCNQPEGII